MFGELDVLHNERLSNILNSKTRFKIFTRKTGS